MEDLLPSAIVSDNADDNESLSSSVSSAPVHNKEEFRDNVDDLYDEEIDDEDEAYVYKHLRGGLEETIEIQQRQSGDGKRKKEDGGEGTVKTETLQVLKPRYSDAILSCPCCLTVVCMDCQKHETYSNQYRAMLVMNIGVHWNRRYRWDDDANELMVVEGQSSSIERNVVENDASAVGVEEQYYSVYCLHCSTHVAYLNMKDEVYHFSGCVASQG